MSSFALKKKDFDKKKRSSLQKKIRLQKKEAFDKKKDQIKKKKENLHWKKRIIDKKIITLTKCFFFRYENLSKEFKKIKSISTRKSREIKQLNKTKNQDISSVIIKKNFTTTKKKTIHTLFWSTL